MNEADSAQCHVNDTRCCSLRSLGRLDARRHDVREHLTHLHKERLLLLLLRLKAQHFLLLLRTKPHLLELSLRSQSLVLLARVLLGSKQLQLLFFQADLQLQLLGALLRSNS